jgi:hypothetical protein
MARRSSPLQLSLLGLLAAVAAIALCLAALTHASPSWGSMFITGTVAVLFLAVSRAVATRGRSRAFWVGFAVWGCAEVFWPGTGGAQAKLQTHGRSRVALAEQPNRRRWRFRWSLRSLMLSVTLVSLGLGYSVAYFVVCWRAVLVSHPQWPPLLAYHPPETRKAN